MKNRYFTLVELLVVIAIIAILAGLAIPAVGIAKQKAKQTHARVDIHSIETALLEYEKDRGSFRALPYYSSFSDSDQKVSINGVLTPISKQIVNSLSSRASHRYYDAVMEVLTCTPVGGAAVSSSTDCLKGKPTSANAAIRAERKS